MAYSRKELSVTSAKLKQGMKQQLKRVFLVLPCRNKLQTGSRVNKMEAQPTWMMINSFLSKLTGRFIAKSVMVGFSVQQNNHLCRQDSSSRFWYKMAENMEV